MTSERGGTERDVAERDGTERGGGTPRRARLEVLVEPFKVNEPGPHVRAAIEAIEAAGLVADMGPFATIAEGDFDRVVTAVGTLTDAGFSRGADAIQIRIERID